MSLTVLAKLGKTKLKWHLLASACEFYLAGKKKKNIPATQIIADSCVTINIAARNSVSKQLQNKWPVRRGLTNLIAIKKTERDGTKTTH